MKNWDSFRMCVSCLGRHNRSDHLGLSTRIEKEQENEVFCFRHFSLSYSSTLRHFLQGKREAWGGQGGSFDAVVGAALLSVVDLPDLSTVNIQG